MNIWLRTLVVLFCVQSLSPVQAFAGIDPTLDDETEEFQEGGALPPWLYLEETPEREERKETPIAGKGFFKSGLEVPFSGGGEFSNGGDFSGGGAFSGGGEYFPDFATPAGGGGAGAGGGGSGGSSGDGGGGGGSSGGGGGTSGGGGVSTGGGGASYNGPVGEPGVLTDEERAALADQQAGIWLDIFEQAGLIVDGQLAFDPLVGGEFNIPPDQQAAVNAMLDQFIADMEAQGIPISPELQAWIDSARNGVLIIDPIDPRSAAALEGITPEMQGMTVVYVTMVNRQLPDGVRYTIVEGFRTLERQAALYSIGRTTELDRAPVTYGAPSPCCPHYRGIAVDGYLFTDDGSAFASDPALYPVLGASTDMLGLDWGGDWGMRDMPHVQLDI